MGYVDKNLISGETVRYRTRLHWVVLLGPSVIAAPLGFMGMLFAMMGLFSKEGGGMAGFGFAAATVAGLIFGFAYLERGAAEFAVTNKRVILKVGLLRQRTAEMFLNKVESIGVNQGILGRIMAYGSITVRGTGGTLEPFSKVPHPLEFRRQVQEQIAQMQPIAAATAAGK